MSEDAYTCCGDAAGADDAGEEAATAGKVALSKLQIGRPGGSLQLNGSVVSSGSEGAVGKAWQVAAGEGT